MAFGSTLFPNCDKFHRKLQPEKVNYLVEIHKGQLSHSRVKGCKLVLFWGIEKTMAFYSYFKLGQNLYYLKDLKFTKQI